VEEKSPAPVRAPVACPQPRPASPKAELLIFHGRLAASLVRDGRERQGAAAVGTTPVGVLYHGSRFVSIACRTRMVSIGDTMVYTGSGLLRVVPYIQF
jgi:hypothetical protein